MNPILMLGAVLGLLAVGGGALAEHLLLPGLDELGIRRIDVALQYHHFGALGVTAVGLALLAVQAARTRRHLAWAGGLLAVGTMLFSFTIYLGAGSGVGVPGWLTPLGGLMQMGGWIMLVWAGWRARPVKVANEVA